MSLDLFNILNDDTISGASSTYDTQWLAPTAVVAPRLVEGVAHVRLLTDVQAGKSAT